MLTVLFGEQNEFLVFLAFRKICSRYTSFMQQLMFAAALCSLSDSLSTGFIVYADSADARGGFLINVRLHAINFVVECLR